MSGKIFLFFPIEAMVKFGGFTLGIREDRNTCVDFLSFAWSL